MGTDTIVIQAGGDCLSGLSKILAFPISCHLGMTSVVIPVGVLKIIEKEAGSI